MSDPPSRSSSPPRIKVPVNLDLIHSYGSPPGARYIVAPGKDPEITTVPHSMLLAQLKERPAADISSSSVMLNVGGVPVVAPPGVSHASLRGAIPQSMFTTQPTGVPILRGSGLVSLPPDMVASSSRASPQPPRLPVPGADPSVPVTSSLRGALASMMMLRVPSPSRPPASHSRTPSPNPPRVFVEDSSGPNPPASPPMSFVNKSQGKKPAIVVYSHAGNTVDLSRGPSPSAASLRVSPNPPNRASPGAVMGPLRVTADYAQRASPAQAVRLSPGAPRKVTPASAIPKVPPEHTALRAGVPTAHLANNLHRASPSPQHRASPKVLRVNPGTAQPMAQASLQHRVSPNPLHRASPNLQHRASPNPQQHRASPNPQHRASPNPQHRASPNPQHRASPNPQHRASPNPQSRASQSIQNRTTVKEYRQVPVPHKQILSDADPVRQEQSRANIHLSHYPQDVLGKVAIQDIQNHDRGPSRASTVGSQLVVNSVTGPVSSVQVSAVTVQRTPPRPVSVRESLEGQPTKVVYTSSAVNPSNSVDVSQGSRSIKVESQPNPFAAAMKSYQNSRKPELPPSQTHRALLDILVKKQPNSIQLQQPDNKPSLDRRSDERKITPAPSGSLKKPPELTSRDSSGSTTAKVALDRAEPVAPSLSQSGTVTTRPNTQTLLHKHLTTPLPAGSSSLTQNLPLGSKPPPLMPLLSSIMGLIPPSEVNSIAQGVGLAPVDGMSHTSTDGAMPKLVPEMLPQGLASSDLAMKLQLAASKIKAEDADDNDNDTDEKKILVPLEDTFNQRVKNLENFPITQSTYKTTHRSQGMAMHRAKAGCITNTARSLDILRNNLQRFINKEIDEVIQRYIEEFFKPGIENIRFNNGQNTVSDEHMGAVCRQILEEAKRMYMSGSRCNTPDPNGNESESGSVVLQESKAVRDKKMDLFKIRKRRPSTDSEASVTKKRKKGRPPLKGNGRSTPMKAGKNDPVKREGPKWDPDRLTSTTQFVMGAKANKALGLGAQRGRIYIKHPELFKYAGEQGDKNWLHEHHHMPATGGKAYLLLVDDIREMAQSDEYKNSPNLMLDEIVGFTVPDWMLQKMKEQMQALRTDKVKVKATPPQLPSQGDLESTLPFSENPPDSTADSKSDIPASPSMTEVMSTEQDDDTPAVSPFNMTGGFGNPTPSEVSPAPSMEVEETDDEAPLTAPFQIS